MKNNELYTEEELAFFEQIESGDYTAMSTADLKKSKKHYKEVAENTIKKMTRKKSLNLRVFESDIGHIKALALEKGLPYQTLLSSIIHQVATRQIKV